MKILALIFILLSMLHAEDIAIVVSKDFDANALDKSDVSRIFLAKTNRVNSIRIKVVELKNSSYKKEFYKNVSGKTLGQLRAYWTTLIFTGKARPPKQIRTKTELEAKIKNDTSVITYLPLSEVTDDMKILYTMKE